MIVVGTANWTKRGVPSENRDRKARGLVFYLILESGQSGEWFANSNDIRIA